MERPLEFAPQLVKVVDLAVEHEDELLVVTHHRLMRATTQVDDRKASRAETRFAACPLACVIGAAVPHEIARDN